MVGLPMSRYPSEKLWGHIMARFYLSHPVKDFDRWRVVFEDHASTRRERGLETVALYRMVGDEDNVLVVLEGDPEGMKQLLASKELGERMRAAGVLASPEIYGAARLELGPTCISLRASAGLAPCEEEDRIFTVRVFLFDEGVDNCGRKVFHLKPQQEFF